jgi:hypothetical protein
MPIEQVWRNSGKKTSCQLNLRRHPPGKAKNPSKKAKSPVEVGCIPPEVYGHHSEVYGRHSEVLLFYTSGGRIKSYTWHSLLNSLFYKQGVPAGTNSRFRKKIFQTVMVKTTAGAENHNQPNRSISLSF